MSLRAVCSGAVLVLLATLAGCSSEPATGQLAGKVLFDGKLVRSGSVKCVDARGAESSTSISPEGLYRLTRLAVGPARLSVNSHTRVPEGMRPPTEAEKPANLPTRYNSPDSSELKVEVRRGETPYDIVMKP